MAVFSVLFNVGAKIGVVELDASISESHELTATATKHRVERGVRIADHVRPEPVVLTIEGLITNTPISRSQQTRAVEFGGSSFLSATSTASPFGVPGYAEEAFAKLDAIRLAGELVTVVTNLRTYDNMALTSLVVPRDRSTGDALRFTAKLEELIFVENKITTIVQQADPRANKKVKLGRQAKSVIKAAKTMRKINQPWTGVFEGPMADSFDGMKKIVERSPV